MYWLIAQTAPDTNFWAKERTAGPLFGQPLFLWILGTFIVTTLLIILISRVPSNFRKPITVGITFLAGMFYVLEFFLPRHRTPAGETVAPLFGFDISEAIPVVSSVAQILTGMLLALGVLSIFRVHFGRLFKMQKDWFFSLILLLSMFLMIGLGIINFARDRGVEEQQAAVAAAVRGGTTAVSEEYTEYARIGADLEANQLYENRREPVQRAYGKKEITRDEYLAQIQAARAEADDLRTERNATIDAAVAAGDLASITPLVQSGMATAKERTPAVQGFNLLFTRGLLAMDAAMFSLIGFFILSAAYRAFRIRSIEASILMATALIVLLMFVPIALMLTNGLPPNEFIGNFRIDSIGMWLLTTLNVPAIRALDLGLGLGLLAMALRIMLGLERGVASE